MLYTYVSKPKMENARSPLERFNPQGQRRVSLYLKWQICFAGAN